MCFGSGLLGIVRGHPISMSCSRAEENQEQRTTGESCGDKPEAKFEVQVQSQILLPIAPCSSNGYPLYFVSQLCFC